MTQGNCGIPASFTRDTNQYPCPGSTLGRSVSPSSASLKRLALALASALSCITSLHPWHRLPTREPAGSASQAPSPGLKNGKETMKTGREIAASHGGKRDHIMEGCSRAEAESCHPVLTLSYVVPDASEMSADAGVGFCNCAGLEGGCLLSPSG